MQDATQPERVVIGLDLGSSSIKASAYDRLGRICAEARVTTPVDRGAGGLDFPVPAMVEAARAVVREVAAGRSVAGVGVSSMGEVGAVVRPDGSLAAGSFPAWHDARGAEVVTATQRALEFDSASCWSARTGGHLRTTSTFAKLGWLASEGEVLSGSFLGLAGLLVRTWTGTSWQESSLAATSGAYDPVARQWLPEIWRAAGLENVLLPAVGPAGRHATAHRPAAMLDGVAGAEVLIAGHDHPVAAVGAGAAQGSVIDSLGTGEAILAAWTDSAPNPARAAELVAAGLTIESWPATGDPLLIREGLRPGLALQALVRECGMTHDELEAAAPQALAPHLTRADCEALEAGDAAALLVLSGTLSWPTIWRGILNAYARDAALAEAEVRAATLARGPLVVTGGGTRSATWLAAKRAATASPLVVSARADTGTRGAGALVGVAVDWWPSASQMP